MMNNCITTNSYQSILEIFIKVATKFLRGIYNNSWFALNLQGFK